jgi:hypothetical protein
MAIRYDPESRHVVDDESGDYLEHKWHFEDPLHHYWVRDGEGEILLIADVAEGRLDTTGERKVDRIEAAVFRVFGKRYDGKIVRIWSRWHPAARRFLEFYKTLLQNQQNNLPALAISFRLWSPLPHNER